MSLTNKLFHRLGRTLPVYRQTEIAECGLACVAMVATYFGHKVDVGTLRQRYPLSSKGTNLGALIKIAASLGLGGRPLKAPLAALNKLRRPAILHWDFSHFVVLKSASRRGCVIHDPAYGERTLTWDEMSDHYTGVALELSPQDDFRHLDDRTSITISALWRRAHGLLPNIAHILLLSLVFQVFLLASPYFIQLTIDEAVMAYDKDLLLVLGLAFISLHLFKSITFALRGWLVTYIGTSLNYQLSNNLVSHLLKLPTSYFAKRHVGDIVSRFSSLDEINRLLTTGFVEAIVDGVMVIFAVAIMLYYSPLLTAIAAGVVVFYLIVRMLLLRPIRRLTTERIINGAKEDSHFLESARAIQTIKLFSHESERLAGWQNRYTDQLNADVKLERIRIGYGSLHSLVTGIEYVVIVWVGALMIMDNEFTIGMLYAFIAYRQQFSNQAQALVDKLIEYKMLSLHLDRIADIVCTKPEINLHTKRGKMRPLTGRIELKNVGFRYTDDDDFVFRNVSLTVRPGESVVIVGPSGCGKTTLLKVMTGLLSPTEGKILIDGVDMRDYGLANFREEIAAIMQDDVLFSGSIMDNITLFDAGADYDKAARCASAANILKDIIRMPMGFQSLVGDLGSTLSGGQKQRIFLARSLYREPRILFMDEATSHLDHVTETNINEVIGGLGMTRISIAHRKETIKIADRVFQLAPPLDTVQTNEPRVAVDALA